MAQGAPIDRLVEFPAESAEVSDFAGLARKRLMLVIERIGPNQPMMSGMPQLARTDVIQPVFSSEPDLSPPDGAISGWLLDPPGALVQFVKPVRGTADLASWLVGPAYEELDARFPRHTDLWLVLDLTHMVGRSAAARSILLHSAKVVGPRFSRVFVVPPADYPPMYLKAFHASVAFARLLGMHVTVAGASRAIVERYKLRALSAHGARTSGALALTPPVR